MRVFPKKTVPSTVCVLGEHDDFDRAVALVPCEIDDQLRTGGRWDQGEPFLLEERSEGVGDHAAGPRTPVVGDDAAVREPYG